MKSNTRSLLRARSAPTAEKEGKPVKKHEHADDGAADVYAGEKPREEQPNARGRRILRAGGEKYQQRARGGDKQRTAQHRGEEHGSSGGGGNVLRPAPPMHPATSMFTPSDSPADSVTIRATISPLVPTAALSK